MINIVFKCPNKSILIKLYDIYTDDTIVSKLTTSVKTDDKYFIYLFIPRSI